VLVNNYVTLVISLLDEHNHYVIADYIVGRQIINSRIKKKCENDLVTKSNKIIRVVLQNEENYIELVHSDLRLWRKSMYDFRRKSMPKIPKSFEESKVQIFDGRENLISRARIYMHLHVFFLKSKLNCLLDLSTILLTLV
jgi:hypothetical protein